MRLDVFLRSSRLIPRRAVARQAIDDGRVFLNGVTGKAGKTVSAGDEIEIRKYGSIISVEVLEVPKKKQFSKAQAAELYRIVSEEKIEDDLFG